MPSLIFLDLETSGLEERDRICELSLIIEDEEKTFASSQLCKSPKKISSEAMSIHHITNEKIKDAKECVETETYRLLEDYNSDKNILIGHNIRFDLGMLKKEGFNMQTQCIDTLRCTKSLIPECDKFNLQYLRYELDLYKQEEDYAKRFDIKIQAHSSLSDALHVKLLFKNLTQYATLAQLIEISSKPVLLEKFSFGKYSGRYIEEIVELDPSYLQWMTHNVKDMDEDMRYSINKYLNKEA